MITAHKRIRPMCMAAVVSTVWLMSGCSSINTEQLGDIFGTGDGLDTETVVAGLKEALTIGTERTVSSASASDGYWGNALIRIVIPSELQSAARTLRDIGFSAEVAKFELAMNRAAEQAAREATGVFWNAIKSMTIEDAWGILNGADTAATVYFRDRTSAELRSRYLPIVKQKMSEVGLYQVYNGLMDAYSRIPLVSKPTLDLDAYVTDRALAGLFTLLASEEERIRRDPAARTTELLQRVFADNRAS